MTEEDLLGAGSASTGFEPCTNAAFTAREVVIVAQCPTDSGQVSENTLCASWSHMMAAATVQGLPRCFTRAHTSARASDYFSRGVGGKLLHHAMSGAYGKKSSKLFDDVVK